MFEIRWPEMTEQNGETYLLVGYFNYCKLAAGKTKVGHAEHQFGVITSFCY